MSKTVAIIGYGTAAINAAIALRSAGFQGKITLFSDTDVPPYSPMMTASYVAGTCDRSGVFPWDACDLESLNVCMVANAPVSQLNARARTLVAGDTEYTFDVCLIATGAHPVVPPMLQQTASKFSAFEQKQPLFLRTLRHAETLSAALSNAGDTHLLVSGTSMVALKVVDACLTRGAQVTVLGRSDHIMSKTACEPIAHALEEHLKSKGVAFRLSQTLEEAQLTETGAIRARFSNAEEAVYNHVLFAHGIAPNLSFITDDAFGKQEDTAAGLSVDEFMRTNVPGVYAAGDVARVLNTSTGKYTVAGLWKEACLQGACAGRAMAAELLEQQPLQTQSYHGFVPNNCVIVGGAVVLSGGTMVPTEQRYLDIKQQNGCLVAALYENKTGCEGTSSSNSFQNNTRLVGYNVFSNDAHSATSLAYDEAAMLYRRLLAQEKE